MDKQTSNIDFLRVMNYVGGALIFFGIAFFITINWFSLNPFVKIFSTFGVAIAAFCIGMLLNKSYEAASGTAFMIAGLVLPIGLYVTFDILFEPTDNWFLVNLVISTICLVVFLSGQLLLQRTILLFFTIIFASIFFVTLSDYIIFKLDTYIRDFYEYRGMVLGLSYVLLGRYLVENQRYPLVGLLYFFGSLLILANSYMIGGFFFFDHTITSWKILTGVLVILTLCFSIILKSRAFLYVGAFFLVIYITDMSSRFVNLLGDFGWPLILVAIGFLLMVVGYLVFALQRRIKN